MTLTCFLQEVNIFRFMKKGDKVSLYGFRLKDLHPGMIHESVARTKLIGFMGPLRLEGMIRTKIKTAHIVRVYEKRPYVLNVGF
jgi:hypothetical protein